MAGRKPIINCHTHIFTGDHVPPYLARTFLPWPLYLFLPLSLLVSLFRFYYRKVKPLGFIGPAKAMRWIWYRIVMLGRRTHVQSLISFVIEVLLGIQVFFIAIDFFSLVQAPGAGLAGPFADIRTWLDENHLLFIPDGAILRLLMVVIFVLLFKTGRNIVWLILSRAWSFLGVLPGPQSKKLALRYLSIGRFAFHRHQQTVFDRLENQYPPGTGFVILPMDMEYMEAGDLGPEFSYARQMAELSEVKARNPDTVFPFVFADPRRIEAEGEEHFRYTVENKKVILNDCFIKEYIESKGFNGFKIYPALGYYPFDLKLLPLWKYAADNRIPILTHCIRGTIFYRGRKKSTWDRHPLFEQAMGNDRFEPLMLNETDNASFCNNFTHPLNYLCLLDERLLRAWVGRSNDKRIHEVFGYKGESAPMDYNLGHLKLCFGHYGGEDEWDRFFESDRDNFTSQMLKRTDRGILFLDGEDGQPARGKAEIIWKNVDWYTIISSLMLQFPNVYADLSYIIHDPKIIPLLKQTLKNDELKLRVLFGTDFYVVRNHRSEKDMLAQVLATLSDAEFERIAVENPREFLSSELPGGRRFA